MFAIKAEVTDPRAETFGFSAQKAMYGGKHVAKGDTIFVFASENEGGPGLIASGVVTSAQAIAKKPGIARQTPRVSISIRRTSAAFHGPAAMSSRPTLVWSPSSVTTVTSPFISIRRTRA